MSNRDFSHVNLAQKKAAQTQYAASITNAVALTKIPGFIVKGGVAPASTGIETVVIGSQAVGTTISPTLRSTPATLTQTTVSNSVKTGVNPIYNAPAAIAASI